jgi:hypothetical protein
LLFGCLGLFGGGLEVFLRTFANHVGAFACGAGSLTLHACVVHAACGVHVCVVFVVILWMEVGSREFSPEIGCCSIFGGDCFLYVSG